MSSPVSATPWRIVELDSTDSTQAEAHRRATAGERGPLWISARSQSQGRGRSGRGWSSVEGNLAATLLFKPGCAPPLVPQLSLVAGVAALDAVVTWFDNASSVGRPSLKWPNDVLIGDAKLVGILVEATTLGNDLIAMAGFGINIASAPTIEGRALTCLAAHTAHPPTPKGLLEALAARMRDWLLVWDRGAGFGRIREAWVARALPEGSPISVNAGDGPVNGTFAGLDTDGALLLLEPSGRRRRFSWGDVTLPGPKV